MIMENHFNKGKWQVVTIARVPYSANNVYGHQIRFPEMVYFDGTKEGPRSENSIVLENEEGCISLIRNGG